MALQRMAKFSLVAVFSAVSACAGIASQARPDTTERIGSQGVSSSSVSVVAGDQLQFVNDDTRAHQIYSNDCVELSSTVLQPGDAFTATVGAGDKTCHFEDLLAPAAQGYQGVVHVDMPGYFEGSE